MNVIELIEGREAIPLRAVPYLSDWQVMTPESLVLALAGDEVYFMFEGLSAYRQEGGTITPFRMRYWDRVALAMKAAEDRIGHGEISHSDGKEQSRQKLLKLLPPGAFVWRDEFEPRYLRKCRVPYFSLYESALTAFVQMEPAERAEMTAIDFDPFIQDEELCVVMEGFKPQQTDTKPPDGTVDAGTVEEQTPAATVAPVAVIAPAVALPDAPVVKVPAWKLTRPKRFQGYTEPLYLLLESAHIAGQAKPTARDVLQAFAKDQPSQIAKVIEGESLDYYLANGCTKAANLRAIAAAITGMTGKG